MSATGKGKGKAKGGGQLSQAVSTLLKALPRAVRIVKSQSCPDQDSIAPTDLAYSGAAAHLSKSLRKNRRDVEKTYRRDSTRLGPAFASGDAEARSSLSAIIARLRLGFISIVNSFSKGQATSMDYQALLSLSNLSCQEAMETFEQLSRRLSQSSLASSTDEEHMRKRNRHESRRSTKKTRRHRKSEHADKHSRITSVNAEGLVRPKRRSRVSSVSTSSKASKHRIKSSSTSNSSKSKHLTTSNHRRGRAPRQTSLEYPRTPNTSSQSRQERQKSGISFASDSTKLGEIPQGRLAYSSSEELKLYVPVSYPLERYEESEKHSRIRRLFRL